MGTPAILYGTNGKPLLTNKTPWGEVLLTAEPARMLGAFKAATNADVQTQTIAECPAGQALFVTDIVLSANKTPASTVTVRFYDGTRSESIVVADSAEGTVNLSIHPQGRTLGWDAAYVQLVTDTLNQDATCTVWYIRVIGDLVVGYAKWNTMR